MTQYTSINILVVYDSVEICQAITNSIDANHVAHLATNGEEAWQLLESTDSISLVFVDMSLATIDSLLLLNKIRADESQRIASLPVIIITSHESTEAVNHISDIIGATGFINKPSDSLAISNLVNSYTKVDQAIPANNQISTYDDLTDCLNERGLQEHCSSILSHASLSYKNISLLCIQLIDFDSIFKDIDKNSVDQIITTVAKHLTQVCRVEEEVAHLAQGRFFIALLTTNSFRAYIAATQLQKKIASLVFEYSDNKITVKAAIGISATDSCEDKPTYEALRLQAEQALQASLNLPAASVVRYDPKYEKGYDEEVYRSKLGRVETA